MSEFTDYLHEVFEPFGSIQVRRMFGGHGVFHDGLMIALVADDCLYLKADRESEAAFTERGLSAFEYDQKGKPMRLSYFLAPEEIFEDPEAAAHWAALAFEAARRAKRPDPKRARKRQKT